MRNIVILFAALAVAGPNSVAMAEAAQPKSYQLAQAARPLVSGERVRLKKMVRDMESALQTIDKGGIAPFQDPNYVKKWRKAIDRYRMAMKKYPQVDDPDVKAATAKLTEFENVVAFGEREAAKQLSQVGDVQAILATIEKNLRDNQPPQWLPAPFGDEEVQAWVRTAAIAKRTAQKSITELQRIGKTAHLPITRGTVQQGAPYDKQDLSRLTTFANYHIRDVGEAVKKTFETLKHQFQFQHGDLDYYRSLDPDNPKHRANAFLMEGAEAEIYSGLDRQLALAKSVVAYQRAFGKEPSAASTARVDEIIALRKSYAANRIKALGDSKLPAAKSTDAQRLAVAKQILATPKYAYGQHGPVVLTTKEIVDREKQVSRAEVKDVDVSLSGTITLSGTETTWTYKWQEFKFATPIKETKSEDWYIWWITAKKFSSGGARTPIGEWVSGAATKGDLILEKNFSR